MVSPYGAFNDHLAIILRLVCVTEEQQDTLGSSCIKGCLPTALFCTILAPFFNRWSDKKGHKMKNVGKGHISIPRTKGFDVAF